MGSGKTTFGKKLAKALNYSFVDTDKKIEETFNTTITELFEKLGEEKFRELESLFIQSFVSQQTVLATGGGLPCFNNNIEALKEKGVVVFLDRPAKELANRLKNAKTNRPIIANKTDDELLSFIEKQLKERLPFYEKAHLIVDRNAQDVKSVCEKLSAIS